MLSDKGMVLLQPGNWEYEFLAVYGLGLSQTQMTQWAWITVSLSLSSLFQIMVWCQTTILWVIPSSCSPIWILMPHCQLQFRALSWSWCSSSIKDLNTEEEGSDEGPDCAILTPDLVTLRALSSRSSLMRPLRYFNQENIQILIRTMEPRAVKFCQLWSTRS